MHLYHSGKTRVLNSQELEALLDDYLEADLQRLDTEPTALALSEYTRPQQDRALYWIKIGAKAHTEIGYCLALNSAKALRLMSDEMMQTWVIHAMGILDTQGLVPAVQSINAVEKFAAEAEDRARGVTFDEVSGMLSLFVQGLSGRRLELQQDEQAWTDTEIIYLPSYVGRFEEYEDNFKLYKSILAHQWAQIWFGTWRVDSVSKEGIPQLSLFNEISEDQQKARLNTLHALESIRLDACIARELPGIHRDMQHVLDLLDETLIPAGWETIAKQLQLPGSTIKDSCQLLQDAMRLKLPERHSFQGVWQSEKLLGAIQKRLEKEKRVSRKQSGRCQKRWPKKQKSRMIH